MRIFIINKTERTRAITYLLYNSYPVSDYQYKLRGNKKWTGKSGS